MCLLSVLFLTGCEVIVGKQKRPLVRMAPIRGSVEIEAERSEDTQERQGSKVKNTSTEFRELLRLKTDGDVYHPNFFVFDTMLGLGLSQSMFETNTQSNSNQGSVREYHLGGQLLPTKPYSSSFSLNRSENVVARSFGSPLNVETESRGFTQLLNFGGWPMTFSYQDSTSIQDSSADSGASDFFQVDEKNYGYTLGHDFSKLSRMHFEFDRRLIKQERFNDLTDRQEDSYRFRHEHFFDEEHRYRLDSFVSFLEQSKDFQLEQTLWSERLRLKHSNTFETYYNVSYSEAVRPTTSNNRRQLQTGFQHRLYESLVTSSRIFVTNNNNNDIQEDIWGGDLKFNYTKKNRWGRFRGNLNLSYQDLTQTGGSTTVTVIDERHPFTQAGSLYIVLDQRNIDTSQLFVRDSARLKTYTENIDYTVSVIGGFTEIQILLGGDIFNDGDQDLSFDYDYLTDPERLEESLTQILMLRQEFENGFSVYYEHHVRTQDITTTDLDFVPDEYVKDVFGADYMKGGLRLQAEYRNEDSTRTPRIRKSISGSYLWPLDKDTRLNVFASKNWVEYTDDNYETDQFSVGGGVLTQLSDRYSLASNAIYRNDNDSRTGKTQGLDWNTELKYVFRQFTYSAGVQMNVLEHLDQKTDNLFLFFHARREF